MDTKEFIDLLASEAHMDRKEAQKLLDEFSAIFEDRISRGDVVAIPGFGNFESRKRNERIISHPSDSGKKLFIPPKVTVKFKPSPILKNSLGEPFKP